MVTEIGRTDPELINSFIHNNKPPRIFKLRLTAWQRLMTIDGSP